MITSIIFTRNRPMQADLCLQSLEANFPQSTHNVLLSKNSDSFSKAYQTISEEHNVTLWKQFTSIFKDVSILCNSSENDYICFFTDDCICYDKVSLPEPSPLTAEDITCISLRMGTNIKHRWCEGECYPDNPLNYHDAGDFIFWNRTHNLYGSYWSYSLSVDGHIFRREDLCEMMDELVWLEQRKKNWKQTPNVLETMLQRFWTDTPQLMVAPKTSKVVNSPNNRVQDTHNDNRSGDTYDLCPKTLLDLYLFGKRLDLNKIQFPEITCPHTELNLLQGL